jgi:hypothetical protein
MNFGLTTFSALEPVMLSLSHASFWLHPNFVPFRHPDSQSRALLRLCVNLFGKRISQSAYSVT